MSTSWFQRLKDGLRKSSSKLVDGISDIFTKRKLDVAALEELEDLLVMADLGPATAAKVVQAIAKGRFDREIEPEEIRAALAEEIAKLVEPVAKSMTIPGTGRPHVILVAGVNGSGKTTTIGKLAKQFRDEGKTVMMAAGDTFRAAAIEQLQVWGERAGCTVVSSAQGSDASGLVFDAMDRATREGIEILLVDTAGRLQNKKDLMVELQKVVRVIKKKDETAPHDTILVLDSTVGQNALSQVQIFGDMIDVTGLVLTKLDGTAKGGVLIALAEKFNLPVYAIGVGESADDLRPFDAKDYARGMMGLN